MVILGFGLLWLVVWAFRSLSNISLKQAADGQDGVRFSCCRLEGHVLGLLIINML